MRGRVLLALSAALVVPFAVSLWRVRYSAPAPIVSAEAQTNVVVSVNRTNVVVRRQFFDWSEIESDDYTTFVANLRRIGCPELTVRDIIIADVNQMFAQRRAQEIVTPESQWWKSEGDMDVTESAVAKIVALEKERTDLLTKLLGPNWNVNFTAVSERGSVALNGPVLGSLNPEVKLKVQELSVAAGRRQLQYIEAQRAAGKAIDPVELARVRMEHRAELAKLLPPDALEEYLLRNSANAEALRNQLRGFEATADEFRAIFRARDGIDNEIQLKHSGTDAAAVAARAQLEQQRDAVVKQALGPERAALYQATADPLFREAQFLAQQSGATPEKVLPLYAVQTEGARERARINADATLTAAQKASAIRAVAEHEEQARRKILGISDETAAGQ
jgi:hypothetical protein